MGNAKRVVQCGGERGASLVLIGGGIVMLLSIVALAIDLGMLYVARGEAQRAADSAALAGAYTFVSSGCTSTGGCVAGGPQETQARQQAEAVGDQNNVAGQAVSIQDSNISFSYPTPEEPQITVVVQRNSIPTFFATMFGVFSANVQASAMAEAYSPSGGSTPISNSCVVPFLVPNCDTNNTSPLNPNCPYTAGYFLNTSNSPPTIQNAGLYPNGVIGSQWQLHFGTTGPSGGAAPSQWYLIAFGGAQSGAQLLDEIDQCSATPITCGDQLDTANGKKVGPVDQGVETRINATGYGLNQGQDSINTSAGLPFQITGGVNNPDPALVGKIYYGPSSSIVSAPVYDGSALNPGGSTVTVVGYMQLFIEDVMSPSSGTDYVDTVIMNVTTCGSGGGGGGGGTPVTSSGGTTVPIRLIHQ